MADDANINDLLEAFDTAALKRALVEAYRRGEAAGIVKGEAVLRGRLESLLTVSPPENPPAENARNYGAYQIVGQGDVEHEGGSSRAPRGLTREVITMILGIQANQTTQDIQAQAVAIDGRLSEKTVYNELNRERDKLYRHTLGRWSLIPQQGERVQVRDNVEELLGR